MLATHVESLPHAAAHVTAFVPDAETPTPSENGSQYL